MAATQHIESWDDDLELEGPILTTSVSTYQNSISSRLSLRSESNAGDDDWNVSLSPNDEKSTSQAISSAKLAGIPIPANVPSSALLGGTITRLGTKRSPKVGKDAWDDDDLELPDAGSGGLTLKKKEPKTPAAQDEEEDDDFDWAEGSLGIRHGGVRQVSKTFSPSASFRSPSMGSVKTAESEEDGIGGLLLPTGNLDFGAALKKRQDATPVADDTFAPSDNVISNAPAPKSEHDDFLTGIDFGAGDAFDPQKRTFNRNVKQHFRPVDKAGPALKPSTTLTFTDRANGTRIPRPKPQIQAQGQPQGRSARLEPVFETGAINVTRSRRFEPTTTSAQLLRSKRSMPVLRPNQHTPTRANPVPLTSTPLSSAAAHRNVAAARIPPYGAAARRDSDPSRPQSPGLRPHSRFSNAMPAETPTRQRRDLAPAALAREAAAKRQVTRPARRRNFGDGTELDTFDDLPTSASKESLYIKQPVVKAQPKPLRSQASQSRLGLRDRMTTPLPLTPRSPPKAENLPRFARDTAASRIAREQTLGGGSKPRNEGPLMPRTNLPAPNVLRSPQTSPLAKRTLRKGPTLVAPMGKENVRHWQEDAAKKGMHWNPVLFRWEGNEKAVQGFEAAAPPSPPRPALITNFGGPSSGTLVSGNMVFDNQAKRWLKLGSAMSDPRSPSVGDEDDPFRDIEDLADDDGPAAGGMAGRGGGGAGGATAGEWLVGEEFDVGPEFVRRQREEEVVWRERTGGWFGEAREREGEQYKWAIRELAAKAA